eukprot:568882-Amorphochlora_amoeboformis.AAC.1
MADLAHVQTLLGCIINPSLAISVPALLCTRVAPIRVFCVSPWVDWSDWVQNDNSISGGPQMVVACQQPGILARIPDIYLSLIHI